MTGCLRLSSWGQDFSLRLCVCRFTEEASGEMNLGQVSGAGQAKEELARVRLQPWPEERLPPQSCPAWPRHRAQPLSPISAL